MLEEVCFHHYNVSHIHQGQDQDNKEDDKSDCPDVLIHHDGVGEVPQVISLVPHRGLSSSFSRVVPSTIFMINYDTSRGCSRPIKSPN